MSDTNTLLIDGKMPLRTLRIGISHKIETILPVYCTFRSYRYGTGTVPKQPRRVLLGLPRQWLDCLVMTCGHIMQKDVGIFPTRTNCITELHPFFATMESAGAGEKQEAANAGTTEPICDGNASEEAGTKDKMGRGDEIDVGAGRSSPSEATTNTNDGSSGTKRKRGNTESGGNSTVDLTADTPEKDTSFLADIAFELQVQREQQLALVAAAHRTRKDSLRLSASRIAALTGFNPYADLPTLILDLIYQGYAGQILLSQDASLLGMELVSRDTAMEELLTKAAKSATEVAKTAKDKAEAKEIQTAVKQITKIQRGEAKPPSTVAGATKMKTETLAKINEVQKKLPKTSKAKLSSGEVKMLNEGIRSAVDTNFGTHHENEALDLYERRYGCEVRERNEGIYCWDFVRGEEGSDEELHPASVNEPTAVPLGLAKKLYGNADEDSADSSDGVGKSSEPPVCVDLTDDVDNDVEKADAMKKPGNMDDSELPEQRNRNHAHSLAYWEASMGSVTNYFMCRPQPRLEIVIIKILSKRAGRYDQLW